MTDRTHEQLTKENEHLRSLLGIAHGIVLYDGEHSDVYATWNEATERAGAGWMEHSETFEEAEERIQVIIAEQDEWGIVAESSTS